MELTFTNHAEKYLNTIIPEDSNLILTTDDGSNNYSSVGATCELADKFQLIILKESDPNFNETLDTNTNYHLNILPFENYLYGNGLTVDFDHGTLVLKDNGGILDSALSVVDWRNVKPETEKHLREKMLKIGDQIC
ncbi:iron-sulfur cluster biosynthesis family protein [Companilactobacillus kimchii]|uniref:Core domain-containing protein n=2 Tax=Companilactobacillus kimchii TaxID=2801452 RepID=A0ABR5NPZ4_9LACO|nr:iron-sulfur cluster biosynthesis family protein [Companilactobacillus kimchii]KAE9562712.1 hypothetical protein ATN91_00690 [Companilactobacillus kimchii]KRK49742.1 hypothetical protein FC97_GL002121 [Companilactobacillus kimchii DSM 13961 = JCM 10707]OWF33294.1 hypothetical protein LKACC12383_01362 [Companilactobacillus kimchii]GEO46622.1 hypothetical protein LKI01_06210 [Companilactobacillus paralimentarius]